MKLRRFSYINIFKAKHVTQKHIRVSIVSVWKIEDIIYFDSCTRTIWLFKIPHIYVQQINLLVPELWKCMQILYNTDKLPNVLCNSYALCLCRAVCVCACFCLSLWFFAEDYKYENVVNKRIKVVYFLIHIAFHI